MNIVRNGLLKKRKERKQKDDRTSENDLPLEMVTVRLMGAHARGRFVLKRV
jgi:hypothetical protein